MPERDLQQQLTTYLTDVHSIEEQALTQLLRAPDTRVTRRSPRPSRSI